MMYCMVRLSTTGRTVVLRTPRLLTLGGTNLRCRDRRSLPRSASCLSTDVNTVALNMAIENHASFAHPAR